MRGSSSQINGAGTFVGPQSAGMSGPGGGTSTWACFEIHNADYLLAPKATMLRLSVRVMTNDIAPAQTFRYALFPVATSVGTSGNSWTTLGTEVPQSSTPSLVSPAADSISARLVSSDFDCPADGLYEIGLVSTGAIAAGAVVTSVCRLEVFNL